ncbi:MAG: hypothetical protein A2W25_08705 [candidate division Zixibacteria bacterium RBG_16_53_22]|nr:MAG: hypothetical protein A2W25_08705 [candidate division Zixibacteria bacterium RBG_16_53_22]
MRGDHEFKRLIPERHPKCVCVNKRAVYYKACAVTMLSGDMPIKKNVGSGVRTRSRAYIQH